MKDQVDLTDVRAMDDAKSALKSNSVRRQALLRNADGSLILSLTDRKNVHDRLKAHTIDDSPVKTPFWRKRPLVPPSELLEGGEGGGLRNTGPQKTSQYVSQGEGRTASITSTESARSTESNKPLMRGIREKRQSAAAAAAAATNTSVSLYDSPESSSMQFGDKSSLSNQSSPYATRSARSLKDSFLQTSQVPSFQLQMPQQSITRPSPSPPPKYNPIRLSPRSSVDNSAAKPDEALPITPTVIAQQGSGRTTSGWKKKKGQLPGAWAFTPQDPNRDKILSPFYSRFFQFFQDSKQDGGHFTGNLSPHHRSPPRGLHPILLAAHLLELHSNVSEVKSNLDALQKRLEILKTGSKTHTYDNIPVESSSSLKPPPPPSTIANNTLATTQARSQLCALRRLLIVILSLQMATIWLLSSWWPTSLILDPSIRSLFNPTY